MRRVKSDNKNKNKIIKYKKKVIIKIMHMYWVYEAPSRCQPSDKALSRCHLI